MLDDNRWPVVGDSTMVAHCRGGGLGVGANRFDQMPGKEAMQQKLSLLALAYGWTTEVRSLHRCPVDAIQMGDLVEKAGCGQLLRYFRPFFRAKSLLAQSIRAQAAIKSGVMLKTSPRAWRVSHGVGRQLPPQKNGQAVILG